MWPRLRQPRIQRCATLPPAPKGRSAKDLARPYRPTYENTGQVEVLPVQGSVYMLAGAGSNVTVQVGSDALLVVDTNETAKAVDFCRKFYQETMLEDVLGWTDVNNNKAYLGEQISCTNNASSILVVAKRDFPEIAKVTDHALNPQGTKGRFHIMQAASHALMTHAPDQAAAKAFLRWLYDDKQMSRWLASANAYYAPFWHGYDNHPMWNVEPRYLP